MDSVTDTDHDVQLALNHADSDNVFQRLLRLDVAIQVLRSAKTTAKSQPEVESGNEFAAKPENVSQHADEVDEMVRRFEGLQTAARHEFNLRARPLLRKLCLLDLPDELLLEIFNYFKGWVDSDQEFYHMDLEVDTKTIQNVRLTCHRLCTIGSHLLIPCVYVSPNLSSLERLEQVASHPTISQGPRVFRIDASFYRSVLAHDIRRFAKTCCRRARRQIENLEWELREWNDDHSDGDPSDTHTPEATRADIEKYRRMLSSWEPFISGTHASADTELDAAALALLKGHERYCELFEQQDNILRDGVFARKIAGAAARSRRNVWLCISDYPSFRCGHKPWWRLCIEYPDIAANPDLVVQYFLSQTHAWWTVQGKYADQAPQSLLYEIPLEMRAAGASLVGFRVNISTPYKLSLELSSDQLEGLRDFSKGLRFFGFDFAGASTTRSYFTRTTQQMEGFYKYLSAAMGQQSAPTLSLGLGHEPDKFISPITGNPTTNSTAPINPELFSTGPLLTSPSWPRIKLIRLHNMSLHLHQLNKLVDMLQPGVRLDFFDL